MKRHLSKEQVDALMDQMEFGADVRTEQLDIPTLLRFTDLVREAAPGWSL